MYLNCHSWFSFHYGTLSIEKLLEEAQRLGVKKLVLTDINNTSGVLDFIRLAPKYGVEPAVGIEFRQGDTVRFIGIAKNNEGFEELNRYLSDCLRQGAAEGESSGNRDAIVPKEIPCFRNVVVILPVKLSSLDPLSSHVEMGGESAEKEMGVWSPAAPSASLWRPMDSYREESGRWESGRWESGRWESGSAESGSEREEKREGKSGVRSWKNENENESAEPSNYFVEAPSSNQVLGLERTDISQELITKPIDQQEPRSTAGQHRDQKPEARSTAGQKLAANHEASRPAARDQQQAPIGFAQGTARSKKLEARSQKPAVLRDSSLFYGVAPSDLSRLPFSEFKDCLHQCVILWPVTVRNKTDFNIHRLLCAIGHNTLLSRVPPNVNCSREEVMLPIEDIHNRYKDFPQLIHNTEKVMRECHIAFDFHEPKNKKTFCGSKGIDTELLSRETWKGVEYRYGKTFSLEIRERVEKELRMINELGFAAYFLINWDIVRYAQRRGYFYVGRGSGANSIVAYCLRITDVDPIDLDLYFERFINPFRQNPPDFDLDFSWKDRDDLTAYIFRRYGEEHTALLATYSTYQSKAIVRELGKSFWTSERRDRCLAKHARWRKCGRRIGETDS
ncbi:MAG: PHP domain-containing protein [Bacteroidetes bacterium]|nr:PHP domain-containing protein [Bacteroidota bacterium]